MEQSAPSPNLPADAAPARPDLSRPDLRQHLRDAVDAFRAGRPGAMADACELALRISPDQAEALQLMGVAQHLLGRHEDALAWLDRAGSHWPHSADLQANRGEVLRCLSRWGEAESALRQAIRLAPNHVEAWNNLGLVLQSRGRPAQADAAYRRALAAHPGHAETLNNLGTLLQERGQPDEAEACYRAVLATRPTHLSALNNLGTALKEAGRFEEAEFTYRRVLALDPRFHRAWNSLGQMAKERGQIDKARQHYQRALELAPGDPDTLYHIALADLLYGDWQKGFAGYEVRYHPRSRNKSAPRPPALPCPMWQGEPLAGRHIAVVREQGLGDQLQFCRYAGLLADAGAEVTLVVDGPLVALLAASLGPRVRVIAPGQIHEHHYDYWAFLLSLPHRLGTRGGHDIPASVPYLSPPADRLAAWKARLARPTGALATIGLVWAGNPEHANNRNRSATLNDLSPLLDIPGLRFVSLQKGDAAHELRNSPWASKLLDLDPALQDFADTAAALSCIDLVISVDTSIVHLAGALDKPCWVLLAHSSDWRWGVAGSHTPWYPSLRLFRQASPRDWATVASEAAAALATWLPQSADRSAAAATFTAQALEALNASRPEVGELACRRAIAIDEQNIDAWHLLGISLKRLGRWADALDAFGKALERANEPSMRAVVLTNQGHVQQAMGDWQAAAASYQDAVSLDPARADAWSALGQVWLAAGQADAAELAWRQGLDSGAPPANLLNLLGAVAHRQGRLDEAERLFMASLRHERLAPVEYNLGNLRMDQGRPADAIAHYRAALDLDPNDVLALTSLLRALQSSCDFAGTRDVAARVLAQVDSGGDDPRSGPAQPVFPFAFLALNASRAQQQRCARQWVARQYGALIERSKSMPENAPTGRPEGGAARNGRLRIGYLSSDFHAHATAYLMAEVFERHDRRRFDITAYSTGPDDHSGMRQRLQRGVDHFIDAAAMGPEALAERIRADGMDILIDLKGYTRDTRSGTLALRPAPLQLNFLGYPGTMGAGFVDYIVGDAIVTPIAHAGDYDERIAQLPHCYQPNDRQRPLPPAPPRAALGLPDDAIVLACFNYPHKIDAAVFERWCRVVQQAPAAVLWLLKAQPLAETHLRREWAARGLAQERLIFAPELPLAEHLARLQQADLVLDTEPYNAHTTASDALWAGVPVITRTGDTFASRVATSLLHAAALSELAVPTAPAYEALAVALANDQARLGELKRQCAERRLDIPLFDSAAWTRDFEALLNRMAWRQQHGLPPMALQAVSGPWPDTSIERAFTLYRAGAFDEAFPYAEHATEQAPQRADAWTLLGLLHKQAGRRQAAEQAMERAVTAQPDYADAWNNLGNLRRDRGDEAGAIAAYREAIRLNPHGVEAHHNLGIALERFDDWGGALQAYDDTIRQQPGHADAQWNRALALLIHGRWREGFATYEWRWARRQPAPRDCAQPLWDGQPLQGQTLLIWAEQGFGDALQFLRFVPQARRQAGPNGRVVLEVLGDMMGLAARIPGVDAVCQRGAPPVAFDCHAPLMSLPHLLGTADNVLPSLAPYIHIDAARGTAWRDRLSAHGWQRERELAVGWVWAGNPNHGNDRHRSPHFKAFADWLHLPGIRWFLLQKGAGHAELDGITLPPHAIDLDRDIHSFDDTAAAIAELDLVITCDTSVAHLAGALGKPVFVTLPHLRDWRWGLDATQSAWYPSARLFRQRTAGDWATVRDEVAAALGTLVRERIPRQADGQPGNADAALHRAHAAYLANGGDSARALADATWALQRAPRRPDAWTLLGALQKRAGDSGRAAEAYRRAIDVDPSYPDAWRNLAKIHDAAGDTAGAARLRAEADRLDGAHRPPASAQSAA